MKKTVLPSDRSRGNEWNVYCPKKDAMMIVFFTHLGLFHQEQTKMILGTVLLEWGHATGSHWWGILVQMCPTFGIKHQRLMVEIKMASPLGGHRHISWVAFLYFFSFYCYKTSSNSTWRFLKFHFLPVKVVCVGGCVCSYFRWKLIYIWLKIINVKDWLDLSSFPVQPQLNVQTPLPYIQVTSRERKTLCQMAATMCDSVSLLRVSLHRAKISLFLSPTHQASCGQTE